MVAALVADLRRAFGYLISGADGRAPLAFGALTVLLPENDMKAAGLTLCAAWAAVLFYRAQPRFQAAWLPWLALLGFGTWATFHALSPLRSIGPAVPRADGLVVWIGYAMLALLASITPSDDQGNLWGFMLAVELVAIIAMIQAFGFPHEFARGRPWATLSNSLFLGGVLALGLPILWGARSGDRPPLPVWLAIPLAALVWSGSRAAIIGGACGILLIRPRLSAKQLAVVLLLAAVIAGAPLVLRSFPSPSHAIDMQDVGDRWQVWRFTLGIIRLHPWGHGFNQVWYVDKHGIWDEPHNDLLYIGLAAGFPGMASYAALWLVALWRADPRRRAALIAYGIWVQFAWPHVGVSTLWAIVAGGTKRDN